MMTMTMTMMMVLCCIHMNFLVAGENQRYEGFLGEAGLSRAKHEVLDLLQPIFSCQMTVLGL